MSSKPLRCRLGRHSWVKEHPADEQYHGPDIKVCRLCGKNATGGSSIGSMWTGPLGGGPG